MKYIVEHFGPALVAMAIFIVLAGVIVGLLKTDGTVVSQFTDTLVSFFTDMRSVSGI